MIRTINNRYIFTFFVAASLAITSCSTDQNNLPEVAVVELKGSEVVDIIENNNLTGSIDSVISQAFLTTPSNGAKNDDCYAVERTDSGMIITFDDCTLENDVNVNGIVTLATVSGTDRVTFTATYKDVEINNAKVTGVRTFIFTGNDIRTLGAYAVTSNMTITLEDGTQVTEKGTRNFGIRFGETLSDLAVTVTGGWDVTSGTDSYAVIITEALETTASCNYIIAGEMTITKQEEVYSVNFGEGVCDDKATVTKPDGTEEEISLKKK